MREGFSAAPNYTEYRKDLLVAVCGVSSLLTLSSRPWSLSYVYAALSRRVCNMCVCGIAPSFRIVRSKVNTPTQAAYYPSYRLEPLRVILLLHMLARFEWKRITSLRVAYIRRNKYFTSGRASE